MCIIYFQTKDGIRGFCLSRGLGEVYERQLKIENGRAMNLETGHLRWEMEKLYDSVDLVTLSLELFRRNSTPEL